MKHTRNADSSQHTLSREVILILKHSRRLALSAVLDRLEEEIDRLYPPDRFSWMESDEY